MVVTPEYNVQDMPGEVTSSAPMLQRSASKAFTVKALAVGDILGYKIHFWTTKPQVRGQFTLRGCCPAAQRGRGLAKAVDHYPATNLKEVK